MTSANWKRVEEIFHKVAERPEAERESTLDELCQGDHDVRREVAELLRADRSAADFIHPPTPSTIGQLLGRKLEGEYIGRTVGPYTIVEVLGVGGMGEVYLARRSDKEFEKEVAVKVIKHSIANEQVLERFRQERQALARLEHKNIARLIDGGTTAEGLPYFVMEYVSGKPLNEHCDDLRLSLSVRLELFLKICSAVDHAHRNLVIHRDLKPGNILVDSDGEPRLLDFGIAKMLDPEETAREAPQTEARLLTPEYASPEQIRGTAISTGSDVYSLGVLLYELLSGHHPYRATTENRKFVYKSILEEDPEKPSTASERDEEIALDDGSTSRISANEVSALRQEPVHALKRKLSGDLDNIVLKAMHKDPARRYASVDALATDIRRYLDGRPVSARGDSLSYRLSKLVRRNLAATALVATLAVIGLVLGGLYVSALLEDRTQLAEIKRLADLERYNSLIRTMDDLWPLHPSQAGAMRDWLNDADELLAELPSHRAMLGTLRDQGRPSEHELADELQEREASLEQCMQQLVKADEGNRRVELERLKTKIEERIEEIEVQMERTPRFAFADADLSSWHQALSTLVASLDSLAAEDVMGRTRANVAQRLERVERLEYVSLEEHATDWEEAIESIVDTVESPQYDALEITPQVGLVPLGRNESTGLWEFWHVDSGDRPEPDGDGGYKLDEGTGVVFILVPGDTFQMGAQKEDEQEAHFDPNARENEYPMVEVTLAPYLLSKYELTQGQWKRLTNEGNGSYYTAGAIADKVTISWTHPVEQVSWHECNELTRRMGWTLPTEAQWEYACRARTDTPWSTGRERDSLIGTANLADQSAKRAGANWTAIQDWPEFDDGQPVHAPVNFYEPNPFGFHSMHGNVWEWCADVYRLSLGGFERAEDGEAKAVLGTQRTVRGGGFNHIALFTRSSYRSPSAPTAEAQSVGFRPAMLVSE